MQHAVIYAFRSPGSGAVYIGKHEPKPDVDATQWPRRGTGRLPDNYKGKGVVVPHFHRRHGAAVQWRILAIVPVADWPRAERRAIHLARLIFGRKCVNLADGGDGLSSDEAQRLWADPTFAAKCLAALARINTDPDMIANRSVTLRRIHSDPDLIARRIGASRAYSKTPEGQAQLRRINSDPEIAAKSRSTCKTIAQTPERKAQLSVASRIGHRKRRARRLLAPFAVPPSIAAPGVCLWAYLPTLRLSIAGPTAPARRR